MARLCTRIFSSGLIRAFVEVEAFFYIASVFARAHVHAIVTRVKVGDRAQASRLLSKARSFLTSLPILGFIN
jgi:hypothetical protein